MLRQRLSSLSSLLSTCLACAQSSRAAFASRARDVPRWLSGSQHELVPGAAIPENGLLALNTLRDNPGSRQQRKRVGRGIGSGLGKTSGRGHKGQKARSGNKPHLAFEGGQTPLRRRLPKRGFVNTSSLRLSPLNLDTLTSSILSGKLDTSRVLNMKDLRDAGAVGKIRNGVKLLGRGAAGFAASGLQGVQIEVSRASATARAAVEAAGGRLTTVHYNALGMRALLKPHKFLLVPRPAQPAPRMRDRVDAVGGLPAGAPPSPVPPALTRRGALLPTGA